MSEHSDLRALILDWSYWLKRRRKRRGEKQELDRPRQHRRAFVSTVHFEGSRVAERWISAAQRTTETDSGWNVKARHLEKHLKSSDSALAVSLV